MAAKEQEVQYFAHYGSPPEEKPWALFVTKGAHAYRYVKHREEWVELTDNWSNVSGFSSDTMGARRISEEEAEALQAEVPDVEPAVVTYFGG